ALEKKSSGIGAYVTADRSQGTVSLALTPEGEAIDQTYKHASRLADEKGIDDRDVLERLGEVESKWPSHPGVVENAINEAIETSQPERAVEIAEQALADWAATLHAAGVRNAGDLSAGRGAGTLFIQLLANYEFALERAGRLHDALSVARLSRQLDPADPEHILSSIVSLAVRTGDAMAALRALEPLA